MKIELFDDETGFGFRFIPENERDRYKVRQIAGELTEEEIEVEEKAREKFLLKCIKNKY